MVDASACACRSVSQSDAAPWVVPSLWTSRYSLPTVLAPAMFDDRPHAWPIFDAPSSALMYVCFFILRDAEFRLVTANSYSYVCGVFAPTVW